jgi:glyoxylase-like metal-dependent hydrolase (beta-lactamase superfamily II)
VEWFVRIIRLPGIHHDANAVIFSGSDSAILVDSGTTWYQALQVERIEGHLGDGKTLERIFLTSRRYPFSGAANHISKAHGEIPIHIHSDAISVMETGDFYSTWANRYDSDMPSTKCEAICQGDSYSLGDGELVALSLPGHCPDGMGYFEKERGVLVTGAILPRADNPCRWDMPGGSLPELIASLKTVHDLSPNSIVPARGPTIKGRDRIDEVLNQHLSFLEQCEQNAGTAPRSWPRPARTAYYLVSDPPWPLVEKESSGQDK